MPGRMPRIVFTPSGLDGVVPVGTTVLQAARQLGVDLDSVCGGRGICGRCQVVPAVGQHSKWAIDSTIGALSPWGDTEQAFADRRGMKSDHRLGCCAMVTDDVVLDVPPESQVHRPVVRKSLDLTEVVLDPAVHLFYVELPPSLLGDAQSMSDLVAAELAAEHGITITAFDLHALHEVHQAFSRPERAATVAVRGTTVVAAWAEYRDRVCGVAVDIGSTTIAGHVCDLGTGEVLASAGRMNPQIRYGEDLMSRVSYVMMNPGGTGKPREAISFRKYPLFPMRTWLSISFFFL